VRASRTRLGFKNNRKLTHKMRNIHHSGSGTRSAQACRKWLDEKVVVFGSVHVTDADGDRVYFEMNTAGRVAEALVEPAGTRDHA
jgi:hypothetical protein